MYRELMEETEKLILEIHGKGIPESLSLLAERYLGQILFSTSFGLEDQVITDIIFSGDIPVKVATLDTGRLFEETYKTHNRTLAKYGKKIHVYFPEKDEVEDLLLKKGPFSFYESVENRKECCNIRKVKPIKRALEGMKVWVTGLRSGQSADRQNLELLEYDDNYGIIKYNPLINWSLEEVTNFIKENHVPYNVLHDRGFLSIGCSPCTRAVQPGDDFRTGRWWWENNSSKECGLHTHEND
jgi:phosphoadenosine phosphosulfate reductase